MRTENIKKSILERILSVFAWLVFVVSLLTAVLSIFSSCSGEKNGKEIFGIKMLIVASNSMSKPTLGEDEPIFFDAGDLIIIRTVNDNTNFKEGDVITFISYNPDSYGKTLTHKIRQVNYTPSGKLIGYTTYGVNTGVNDKAIVAPESIIGVYENKIPKLGFLFSYLQTPAGYYLSILTPSILLIIFFSINVGKYFGRKEALAEYSLTDEYKSLKDRVQSLEEQLSSLMGTEVSATQEEQPGEELALIQTEEQTEESNKLEIKGNKVSFAEKLLSLDQSVQEYFNKIHNELVSYKKVNGRLSFKCISYRKGRKLLAKITVRGKTLKLHLALDVNAFDKKVFFQKDMASVKAYKDVPFTVKVKSNRGQKNALKLVDALMVENECDSRPKKTN